MKLYHYVAKPNDVLENGLLSFATNPNADISYYIKHSGCDNQKDIINWMENCFDGRSRGIRGFSEPIQYHAKSEKLFKNFIDNSEMFSFDLKSLEKDKLIEAIYVSPNYITDEYKDKINLNDEYRIKLNSIDEVGSYEVDWSLCDYEKGLRFSVIPYYIVVIKGGIIKPKYLTKEK